MEIKILKEIHEELQEIKELILLSTVIQAHFSSSEIVDRTAPEKIIQKMDNVRELLKDYKGETQQGLGVPPVAGSLNRDPD